VVDLHAILWEPSNARIADFRRPLSSSRTQSPKSATFSQCETLRFDGYTSEMALMDPQKVQRTHLIYRELSSSTLKLILCRRRIRKRSPRQHTWKRVLGHPDNDVPSQKPQQAPAGEISGSGINCLTIDARSILHRRPLATIIGPGPHTQSAGSENLHLLAKVANRLAVLG
jgi:hypothetical protein